MPGRFAALRRHRAWVLVVAFAVLAGAAVAVVTAGPREVAGTPVAAANASATVGPSGVNLSMPGFTVHGGSGVAPDATVLTASATTNRPPAGLAADTTGIGAGIALSMGGRQPASPLTLTFTDPVAPPPGQAAVLITVPSAGGAPQLIPAAYDARAHTITASVSHLSWFWPAFLDFRSLARKVTAFLTQTTGLTTARPDCAGQRASSQGLTVTLAGNYGTSANPVAWPCVTISGSTVSVALTSDSPLPWRIDAAPAATLQPQAVTDPTGMLLLAAYQTLVSKHPYAQGLLIPGESMTYQFNAGDLPGSLHGTVDVGTWAAMGLLFAFTEIIDAFGINVGDIPNDADAIGCLSGAVTAARLATSPSVAALAGLARSVLACLGPVAKAAGGELGEAGLVIGLLTTGVSLIGGGMEMVVAKVTGNTTFTIPIATDVAPTKVVRIRPVDAQGRLAAGFVVDRTVTGDTSAGTQPCQPGSEVVGSAYRCFGSDNGVYDPCWPDRDNPGTPSVVCLLDPSSPHVIRILLTQPVDPPDGSVSNPVADEPWAVQLSTGLHCSALEGTHDTFDGQVVDYYCDDKKTVLLRGVKRGNGRWTMTSAHYDSGYHYTAGSTVDVTTAWYGLPAP
ncbi:MAG TPA: hypothetical protein VJ914_40040 [Pseudonocardiaceae bacterium]|nr:hypothetical protein [Pseudonocardiaceae bacterium]